MSIQTPLRSRLLFAIGGLVLVATTLYVTWYAIAVQHSDATVTGIAGISLAAAFAAIMVTGARSVRLRADAASITLHPAIGRARTVPRAKIASIARVGMARGISMIELRASDGETLLHTTAKFTIADVTQLADYLDVPFRWD
jgi:hypothetical protein